MIPILKTTLRRLVAPLALVATLAMPAFAEHGFLLPESISDNGDKIDQLFYVILAVTGLVFLGTEGLLIYFIIKYRAREGGKAHYTTGNHRAELIWTITPAAFLLLIAVLQFGIWQDIKFPSRMPTDDPDAVEVHVLAQQFAWKFRYAGPDRVFGTEDDYTYGKLVVPSGRPVVLQMRSVDVIHSLFVPELRFKQDLVPGLTITAWFQAREGSERDYEIACAELCGASHYTMRGEMEILANEDWEARDRELSAANAPIDYALSDSSTEIFRFWPPSEFSAN
ncbi:MAG: cytochrome c oxidase subunit II [Planctomycetes bacterium]|nr:cytochrome c oxidase subunit II [Planctomycetota bacterium]